MSNFTNAEMQKISELGIELQLCCEISDTKMTLDVECKGKNKQKVYVVNIVDKTTNAVWKEKFDDFDSFTEFIYSRIYSQEIFDMNGIDTNFDDDDEFLY